MKKAGPRMSAMTRMALTAMQEVVAKVVEEHRRDGRPLAIWRDGKVALVYADELDEASKQKPRKKRKRHGKKS